MEEVRTDLVEIMSLVEVHLCRGLGGVTAGGIANYYPDFIVKQTEADVWVIETKGREDLEDPRKWERLCQWCEDASAKDPARRFRPLFDRQEKWDEYRPKTFKELCAGFQAERA